METHQFDWDEPPGNVCSSDETPVVWDQELYGRPDFAIEVSVILRSVSASSHAMVSILPAYTGGQDAHFTTMQSPPPVTIDWNRVQEVKLLEYNGICLGVEAVVLGCLSNPTTCGVYGQVDQTPVWVERSLRHVIEQPGACKESSSTAVSTVVYQASTACPQDIDPAKPFPMETAQADEKIEHLPDVEMKNISDSSLVHYVAQLRTTGSAAKAVAEGEDVIAEE
ncbi:hypothetical protein QFC21_006314 [Naganishia friedmannii]|uniref:Uncharacterized protein n=1 Tax=Naganishia friedmannii TaxID=89922 RepID=A0ACC2V3N1_9TREE|nr:hypothetical protein QFC21_006314 [Naganishia friedmannii]